MDTAIKRKQPKTRRRILFWVVCLIVIALLEIFFFNLRFWQTLTASPAPANAVTTIGSGLSTPTQYPDGIFEVTDSQNATVTVSGLDSPVEYVRINPGKATAENTSSANTAEENASQFLTWTSVRIRVLPVGPSEWRSGQTQQYGQDSPQSHYLTNDAYSGPISALQVQFLASNNSELAYESLDIGVHVPFSVNPVRILVMLLIALFIFCFRPQSKLYRIGIRKTPLSLHLKVVKALVPIALLALVIVATCLIMRGLGADYRGIQSSAGNYDYDFEQYNYAASAILHGSPWLDLPVPDALTHSSNPHSPLVQSQLLQQGVGPIYWDHAFYNGHWYSYFGVLPTVLIFFPFQALTGALGISALLPTAAVALGLALFAILALSYLVIRFIHLYFPTTSLGTELLCVLGAIGATNLPFLMSKLDFYTLPMSASMVLTFFGLWFWLGAKQADTGSAAFRWRIALGSLLIAANIGCRPTFLIAALLAFPIFWPEIRSGLFFKSLKACCAALVPAVTAVIPILWFNFWRFGSFFDFGNAYQVTVNDMGTYHTPVSQLPRIMWYYLGQPLHFTSSFPFIGLAPATFSDESVWSEPRIGGYFALAPFSLLVIVALFTAFAAYHAIHRRVIHRKALLRAAIDPVHRFTLTAVLLGILLCVFDAYAAGLSWRYMTDFAWLLALAAVAGACQLENRATRHSAIRRMTIALVTGLTLLLILFWAFVPGRPDDLLSVDPGLYFDVKSWF